MLDYQYIFLVYGNSGREVKNEKAVREFEYRNRNVFFNYFNPVSVLLRIYSLLPRIEASKLVYVDVSVNGLQANLSIRHIVLFQHDHHDNCNVIIV